ncbi:tetratricopeptide repeat protein [Pseudomonas sp. EA_35y_Pfl2_R111]|uniref:tetratricopeptide repeat protein n=1 Tax=Pseudomonas sp. EA_35y_Pfl2_R111 TaxID=3088689 RepID=UPI0030DC4F8F
MRHKLFRFIMLSAICLSAIAAQENADLSRGFTLYNQHDWINSQEPLRNAAKTGNSEAQYYLAETLRLSNRYMTEESQQWYEAAAEQNDLFAMIRLSKSDDLCGALQVSCKKDRVYWKSRAKDLAQEQAQSGNNVAMHALYYLTGDRDWLKKAADAGNHEAGYFLADLILSETRKQETGKTKLTREGEKILRKSAEEGNPKAMSLLSLRLNRAENYIESKKWLEKCLLTSHADCVLALETIHKGRTDIYQNPEYTPNKAIAYGLLLFRRDALGKAKTSWILDTFEDELTSEQKAEGEKFFHKWKKTHPPLSFHVPKLGF